MMIGEDKMNRTAILISLLALSLALFGCRRDAQPDPLPEAEAEEAHLEPEVAAAPEPTVPMCGDWVVVVEQTTVTGDLDGNRVFRALLDGLRDGGCEAHTSQPVEIPGDISVLKISPRLQATGGGSATFAVVATDTASGEVYSRMQERIASGDGTPEARQVGKKIAERLAN